MHQVELEALTHLPVAIMIYEYRAGEVQLRYMNQQAETIWHCTPEEWEKMERLQLFSSVHPEDVRLFLNIKELCRQKISTIAPICFRLVHQGQTRWIQMDISAVAQADSVMVYTTMTDVTGTKHMECELRIQQEEYRLASEYNQVYVFRYSLKTKTLEIGSNPSGDLEYQQIIEDVPNSFIQRGFVSPEDIDQVYGMFNGMKNKERTGSRQIRCVINGIQRLVRAQYTLMEDGDGEQTIAVGFFQDMAHAKKGISPAEREDILRLLAVHTRKHVFRFDHRTQKVTCMQTPDEHDFLTQWILGYINEEKRVQVDETYAQTIQEFHQRMVDGEPTGVMEYPVKDQGIQRWYRAIFTNVIEEDGANLYGVISMEECTQERERAKAYALFQQEKANLSTHDSMMEYNVTRRTISGVWGLSELTDTTLGAEEVLETHLKKFAFIKDAQKVESFFNRERMLEAYANNVGGEEMEHRIVVGGKLLWVESKIQYFQDLYTQDVMAMITSKSVQDQHEKIETLRSAVRRDGITGLYQYDAFQEKVDGLCANATTQASGWFVLIAFRMERDTTERIGLEAVLNHVKKVANTLKTIFSNGEVVGRLEGYQFGVYSESVADVDLLNDKIELAKNMMRLEKDGVQYLHPYSAVVTCPAEGENTLTLWQKTLQMTEIRKKTDRTVVTSKVPYIAYDMESRVAIRAFGYFDVFVDGQAIHFKTAKAKELLAILVDRCGGYVDAREGAMLLYEDDIYDERLKSKYRKVVMRLDEILREYGIEDVIGKRGGSRKLNTQQVYCDYYRYLSGEEEGKALFRDAYMSNYSWGEETLANLLNQLS